MTELQNSQEIQYIIVKGRNLIVFEKGSKFSMSLSLSVESQTICTTSLVAIGSQRQIYPEALISTLSRTNN